MQILKRAQLVLLVTHALPHISMGQHSPQLRIEKVTERCYVYTTWQPLDNGHYYPANGVYVVGEDGVFLIDSPWDSTQLAPLLDSIALRHRQAVRWCVATHFHNDRTRGLAYYSKKGIATYTTALTDSLSIARGEPRAAYRIPNDTTFDIGGTLVTCYYPGPGHTEDNIVIWVSGDKLLHGGCFVKSTQAFGLGNLADARTALWPLSLKKMATRFPRPRYIIPGHEDWRNKRSIRYTRKLLRKYR